MDEVATASLREPGHVLLLASDPFEPVSSAHWEDFHRRDLAPRAPAGLGRIAVDEAGDPQALASREPRNQLAGVGLHSAHLTGHQEHEVQRDVDRLTPVHCA